MRTQDEINAKIAEIKAKQNTLSSPSELDRLDILIEVLEDDLDSDDIEEKWYDGHETDTEQFATTARQWMDGEITDEEFKF